MGEFYRLGCFFEGGNPACSAARMTRSRRSTAITSPPTSWADRSISQTIDANHITHPLIAVTERLSGVGALY
jgi:hypothetical protein